MAHPRRGEATVSLTRALSALRRACSTGRDAQTVTVRRGHLRELIALARAHLAGKDSHR